MTRITPVSDEEANLFVRGVYRETRKRVGHVIEPARVTARHPKLLAATGAIELAFERSHQIDEHLKELATLKAATLVGCAFCIDIGSMMALKGGLSERQLRELHDAATSDAFDDDERLVLELAEAMTLTPVVVEDELWTRLRARFAEPALVELVAMIGWEQYRARTNHAFGLGSEGFSSGAACAVPAPAQRDSVSADAPA